MNDPRFDSVANRLKNRAVLEPLLLGQDNAVILAELGYSETEQQDLKTKGVI